MRSAKPVGRKNIFSKISVRLRQLSARQVKIGEATEKSRISQLVRRFQLTLTNGSCPVILQEVFYSVGRGWAWYSGDGEQRVCPSRVQHWKDTETRTSEDDCVANHTHHNYTLSSGYPYWSHTGPDEFPCDVRCGVTPKKRGRLYISESSINQQLQ